MKINPQMPIPPVVESETSAVGAKNAVSRASFEDTLAAIDPSTAPSTDKAAEADVSTSIAASMLQKLTTALTNRTCTAQEAIAQLADEIVAQRGQHLSAAARAELKNALELLVSSDPHLSQLLKN